MVYYKIKLVKEYKNIHVTNNNIHIHESKCYYLCFNFLLSLQTN